MQHLLYAFHVLVSVMLTAALEVSVVLITQTSVEMEVQEINSRALSARFLCNIPHRCSSAFRELTSNYWSSLWSRLLHRNGTMVCGFKLQNCHLLSNPLCMIYQQSSKNCIYLISYCTEKLCFMYCNSVLPTQAWTSVSHGWNRRN